MKRFNCGFWKHKRLNVCFHNKASIPKDLVGDCEFWSSKLELQVHELLIAAQCELIHRQFKLILMLGNEYFPDWEWKIDFLAIKNKKPYFIECKGDWILHDKSALELFKRQIHVLSRSQSFPSFMENFYLVGNSRQSKLAKFQKFITIKRLREILNE